VEGGGAVACHARRLAIEDEESKVRRAAKQRLAEANEAKAEDCPAPGM
jgi:hypothetical protein